MFSVGMIPNKTQKLRHLCRAEKKENSDYMLPSSTSHIPRWDMRFSINVCPHYEINICEGMFLYTGDIFAKAGLRYAFPNKPDVKYSL